MNPRLLAIAIAIVVLVMSACGFTEGESTVETAVSVAPPPAETPASIDVKSGTSTLGDVLTSPDGLTLYGFTNDVDAISACYGTCADAWPPVVVDVDWTAGPGLDFGIFATTVREDGSLQLVAGQWPLYSFAGDAAPGDVNGQGSGGVWFAVGTDGRLIEDDASGLAANEPAPAAAPVAAAETALGEVLVDDAGLTLYGFLEDTGGVPTCDGACADAWPPLTVGDETLPAGLDPDVFSIAGRPDGAFQLVAGSWPLYRFAGDGAPGDVNGQASGGVWFVAAPDGTLIGSDAQAAVDSGGEY